MAGKSIQFSGINRAVSDYSQSGACEELISLRPTQTGLVPAKALSTMMQDITYQKVFEHNVGDATNYIAIYYDESYLYVYQVTSGGVISSTLWTLSVGSSFSVDSVDVAVMGYIVTISVKDDNAEVYENRVLRWNGSSYELQEANVPDITASFGLSTPAMFYHECDSFDESTDTETIKEIVNTGLNALQEQNKTKLFGTIVIAIAFKTTDGNTFWTNKWYTIDPRVAIDESGLTGYAKSFVATSGSTDWPYASYSDFYDAFPNGGYEVGCSLTTSDYSVICFAGCQLTMTLSQITGWDEDTSTIKSVEIYASRPQLYVDTEYSSGPFTYGTTTSFILCGNRPVSDMNLGGQLLYHQKTYDLNDLVNSSQSFTFEFGGNTQTTNATLEVDAGAVIRTGRMLSYNSRLHFYDSNKRVYIGVPDVGDSLNIGTATLSAIVTYKSDTNEETVYAGDVSIPENSSYFIVVAPSHNIKEVILYGVDDTLGEYLTYKFAMTPSTAYNYSICDVGPYYSSSSSDPDEYYAGIIDNGAVGYMDDSETNAINVSEQYNPFVFRVEHSYLAPSTILDVQPQMVAVSDVSFGDYPLNVFTAKGVYALLQGSGTVLYGAFRPVSNLVSMGNSAVTEAGTFFLASGSLWTVAGSRSVLVSDAISLGPHTFIRDCTGYQSIANGGTIYDISDYESQVSFEVFSDGATISYNRYRDELIISNASYPYSYVLSLKYRQWFKIPYCLKQDSVGSDIVSEQPLDGSVSQGTTATLTFDINGSTEDDTYTVTITMSGGTVYSYVYTLGDTGSASAGDFQDGFIENWNDLYGSVIYATDGTVSGTTGQIILTFVDAIVGEYISSATYLDTWNITEEVDITFVSPYSVLNFSDETDTGDILVHLQSRPFSFGYGYSHIHRLVSMVRTALTSEDENITAALYGSDNLQDWTLLTYSAKQGSTSGLKLSQLRTAPAARSWRYYTITIGGNIPVDTDFGPVLLDVESVIRRMG